MLTGSRLDFRNWGIRFHPRSPIDRRFLAGPRPIVERRSRTIGQGPFDATLDSLMVHPDSLRHRKKRLVFPVGEQYSRPLDPARRLRPRPSHRAQPDHIFLAERQFNCPPPSRHEINPRFRIKQSGYKSSQQK